MKKFALLIATTLSVNYVIANEVPLCALPQTTNSASTPDNAKIEGDVDPGCQTVLSSAQTLQASVLKIHPNDKKYMIPLTNNTSTPNHITVGTVYLAPISMAPDGMMRPQKQSDIHLEIDIHAKDNIKSSGFAPGDWLPNATATYSIRKLGDPTPINCGFDMQTHKPTNATECRLMPMVASDGAHYGDNVKLNGPGFYVVTFKAKTNPMMFGWHTDTDSKILSTAYVDWQFQQNYIFKWTGIGKKGGY